MAVTWTITYGATTNTLAAWGGGLSNVVLQRYSQAADVLTFRADNLDVDDDRIFAHGQTITLKRNGVAFFVGRLVVPGDVASAGAEGQVYEAHGPWWYLDNLVMQQTWAVGDGVGGTLLEDKSRLCLFGDDAGNLWGIQNQLQAALQYAITAGAPFAIGSLPTPDVLPPLDEGLDLTCSEVVRKCLRWAPDAVTWFDYTTSPPTLNISRYASLSAAALALGSTVHALDLRPRDDMKVPAVVLRYERTGADNLASVTTDKAPGGATGLEFGGIVATIDLKGVSGQNLKQDVVVEEIDTASADWWKARVKWLAAGIAEGTIDVASISIHGVVKVCRDRTTDPATTIDPDDVPNELVSGAIADWMTSVVAGEMTVTALIDYDVYKSGTGAMQKITDKAVTLRFTATDATTRTYRRVTNYSPAEPVPAGLAALFYNALAITHYQGSVVNEAEDVGATAWMGKRLNVTGGRAAWSSMNALITQLIEDIDQGRTTIVVGPPPHLTPNDIVELLRASRDRRLADFVQRSTAAVARNTEQSLPHTTRLENATAAEGRTSLLVVLDPSAAANKITTDAPNKVVTVTDGTKTAVIDLANAGGRIRLTDGSKEVDVALNDLPSAGVAKFRAYAYCDTGVQKTVYLLGTVPA